MPFGLKPSEISGLTLWPEWQTFIWCTLSFKIFGFTQDFSSPLFFETLKIIVEIKGRHLASYTN